MSLNGDLVTEILGRVDSVTLANAGCVSSDFWSVARQERIWEEKCCSLWPSTGETGVKELISSSLGGFRKFYANCFPLIACDGSKDSNCGELKKMSHGRLGPQTSVPSDYVSLVDLQYMNKVIYSRIVWGIPDAGSFQSWFCNCPFRIDLINFWDVEDEDQGVADHGLPTIVCVEKVRKDEKFLEQLMDNFKLSWILINRKTGQAANLSSWRPFDGRRHSDADFALRFGSILPAHNILPSKLVQCLLVIKFRLSDSDHNSLEITELGMQLEDMMGAHVNGRNSLLILERALGCRKSKDHDQILQSYHKYKAEQRKLREAKMRNEARLDTLCTLSGIAAFASFCYLIFVDGGAISRL